MASLVLFGGHDETHVKFRMSQLELNHLFARESTPPGVRCPLGIRLETLDRRDELGKGIRDRYVGRLKPRILETWLRPSVSILFLKNILAIKRSSQKPLGGKPSIPACRTSVRCWYIWLIDQFPIVVEPSTAQRLASSSRSSIDL